MRHIAIFGDDLEALDCLSVADYVVKIDRSVFLNPVQPSAFTLPDLHDERLPWQVVRGTSSTVSIGSDAVVGSGLG